MAVAARRGLGDGAVRLTGVDSGNHDVAEGGVAMGAGKSRGGEAGGEGGDEGEADHGELLWQWDADRSRGPGVRFKDDCATDRKARPDQGAPLVLAGGWIS